MGLIELLGVLHLKQIDLNVLVMPGARFSKVEICFICAMFALKTQILVGFES